MKNIIFIAIIITLFTLTKGKEDYPQLQTFHNVLSSQGYLVRNFMAVPYTNMIIVNAIQNESIDSNIVYYYDISSSSGEVINIIKPEYIIIDMYFSQILDQIILISTDRIIYADPYTLSIIKQITNLNNLSLNMNIDSQFAIITTKINSISILDLSSASFLATYNYGGNETNNVYETQSFISKINIGYQFLTYASTPQGILSFSYNSYEGFQHYPLFRSNKISNYYYKFAVHHDYNEFIFVASETGKITVFKDPSINYKVMFEFDSFLDKILIRNIVVKEIVVDGGKCLEIMVGNNKQINKLKVQIDYNNNVAKSYLIQKFYQINFYNWYVINNHNKILISAQSYFSIYTYDDNSFIKCLYFQTDGYSNSLFAIDADQNNQQLIISFNQQSMYINKRGNHGEFIGIVESKFSKPLYNNYNNILEIKNSTNNTYLAKLRDDQGDYLAIFSLFPLNQSLNSIPLTGSLPFKWSSIQSVDPFYYENSYWIIVAYIDEIQVININNPDLSYQVQLMLNKRKLSFALVSLEDPSNKIIIGVDENSIFYVWDLPESTQQPILQLKYMQTYNSFLKPVSGIIFQYQKIKKLILVSLNSVSYEKYNQVAVQIADIHEKNYLRNDQFLTYLTSIPSVIKMFSSINCLAISDKDLGVSYIYKYDPDLDNFSILITIQPIILRDTVLSIELIKETTIWIQYTNSQLFYDLKPCLQNSSLCKFLELSYYFNHTNQQQNSNVGLGTIDSPYKHSQNYFIPIQRNLQYQQIISGFESSKISILISQENPFLLTNNMISFSFANCIHLELSSYPQATKKAIIQFDSQLSFISFKRITLKNVLIEYSNSAQCGLNFVNIKDMATIDDIEQISNKESISCQKILVSNTLLQIEKYIISDTIFNENSNFIQTNDVDSLLINHLQFTNCLFAENFQIINQATNLNLQINYLSLINNYCDENYSINNYPYPLISARNFDIYRAEITNNTFCNNYIFGAVASFTQETQIFSFQRIQMTKNTFYTQIDTVFFKALYQFLIKEKHQLFLFNSIFTQNRLKQKHSSELQVSSLIQTNKIAKIIIDYVTYQNQTNIQLLLIENSQQVIINEFYCFNNYDLLNGDDESMKFTGCIEIIESKNVTINGMVFNRKTARDNPLFIFKNVQTKESTLQIDNSIFSNLGLEQTIINSNSNPIYIYSNFQITVKIANCRFFNNNLRAHQFPQSSTSTTGLWINAQIGDVIISDSAFNNCYSNSNYNFMFINSNSLFIQETTFSKSSFKQFDNYDNIQDGNLFIQQGGMMNIKVNSLTVSDSNFAQSTALKGSFFFAESQGSQLNILISRTSFSEGYSLLEGGAFYLDSLGQVIKFTCQQCNFTNIYTGQQEGSSISIQKYEIASSTNEKNNFIFDGGILINIFGNGDNNFISIQNSSLILTNIPKISSQNQLTQKTITHTQFQSKYIIQQATILNLHSNSQATIFDCHFSNLQIEESYASSLIANLSNSNLTLDNSSIRNSIFTNNIIYAKGGNVTFSNTEVSDVNQSQHKKRILQYLVEKSPQKNGNSLIIIDSGRLEAIQESSFKSINCYSNCNGGVFQVINGSVNLQNIVINNTQSSFGGGLFINGITGTKNIISQVNFQNCISLNDGGAFYFKSLSSDQFKIQITNSNFEQNIAKQGRGGAIFIRSDSHTNINQILNIDKSNFTGNTAKIGGGIDSQNISPIISNDSIFQNNKGELFGDDKLSYPSKLSLITQPSIINNYNGKIINDHIELNDFKSGDSIKDLSFQLRDKYDQIIIPITTNQLSTYNVYARVHPSTINHKNYDIRDILTANFNSTTNLFTFDVLKLVGELGSSVIIQFRSDQIYTLNQNNHFEQNYSFDIKINFRNCINGEQIKEYNDLTECETCKQGKYSYNIKQCKDCPEGAICNGGTDIIAKQGYWRKTNESEIFHSCDNQESNCIGGQFGNNICFEGHIGALCEECDIQGEQWGTSYSRSSKYSCQRCDQIKYNIWVVVFMVIFTIFSMTLAIKSSIKSVKKKAAASVLNKYLRRRQFQQKIRINCTKQQEDKSSIYIKMLTNYMQIVSCISSFNLDIPDSILIVPKLVGTPLQQQTNSLDCAIQEIATNIPIIYLKLIFQMMIPIFYLILFIIIIGIDNQIKKKKKFPWYKISTGAMFQIIYFQPDLVSQIIALLSCRKIGDTYYILSNISYECYSAEHVDYIVGLVLPLFILWVFILPITLFQLLKRNKGQLDQLDVQLKYGFLFKEYTDKGFYWEFIKMAQKIAIILVLNFYSQSIKTKGILIIIIIFLYGQLSSVIKPYKKNDINHIDQSSTLVCAATVLLAIFIYSNPYNYLAYIAIIVIVFINLKLIVDLLIKIIQQYLPRAQKILIQIVVSLSKKFPFFRKFIKQRHIKKEMNLKIREKIQKLFYNFINMKPYEKKIFFQRIFEESYKHLIDDQEENRIICKQLNQKSNSIKLIHCMQTSQIDKISKNYEHSVINNIELIQFQEEEDESLQQEINNIGTSDQMKAINNQT